MFGVDWPLQFREGDPKAMGSVAVGGRAGPALPATTGIVRFGRLTFHRAVAASGEMVAALATNRGLVGVFTHGLSSFAAIGRALTQRSPYARRSTFNAAHNRWSGAVRHGPGVGFQRSSYCSGLVTPGPFPFQARPSLRPMWPLSRLISPGFPQLRRLGGINHFSHLLWGTC